jgi:hypothetical protein
MFIKYFIPEDGDEQGHPNVFRIESTQPTLSDVKKVKIYKSFLFYTSIFTCNCFLYFHVRLFQFREFIILDF